MTSLRFKFLLLLLVFLQRALWCTAQPNHSEKIVLSETFELVPLTAKIWMHVSLDEHPQFGKFTSNGLLYINENEAVICDSPPTAEQANLLLNWLAENKKGVKVKAVIVNYFHSDCLGGISEFHKAGITSYGYELTPKLLADSLASSSPTRTFSNKLNLKIGRAKIAAHYFGEGHSRDNIVVWLSEEKVLFGGCMVKSMGAGKGNLADANTKAWAYTVQKVKEAFSSVKVVIPGHGEPGGAELLDYTIEMFREEPR